MVYLKANSSFKKRNIYTDFELGLILLNSQNYYSDLDYFWTRIFSMLWDKPGLQTFMESITDLGWGAK